jgi:hypothetical protein
VRWLEELDLAGACLDGQGLDTEASIDPAIDRTSLVLGGGDLEASGFPVVG